MPNREFNGDHVRLELCNKLGSILRHLDAQYWLKRGLLAFIVFSGQIVIKSHLHRNIY